MLKTLAQMRVEAGYLTQQNLANAIGVSRVTVARWETGSSKPLIKKLVQLSHLLQVSEQELISALTISQLIKESSI